MKIKFSPTRSDMTLSLSKQGDALIVNGEVFDFSLIPEGATLPAEAIDSDFFCGDVERKGSEICLTLLLPHGANPSQAVAFPQPITVTADGQVELPQ